MNRLYYALSTALLCCLLASPASAKVCKRGYVSGLSAWNITNAGARIGARKAWRRKVRARYGSGHANWTRSSNKSIGCWNVKRNSTRRNRCRVRARPCRL
jgi:hypothetical protein